MKDNIEEVKKILAHYFSDSIGVESGDDIAEIMCQLFPQPLDDKELREKMAEALYLRYGVSAFAPTSGVLLKWEILGEKTKERWRKNADQIYSTLLQPKIEEARRQERERIVSWLYEHNTLKELDHAKHQVGLDLTYEDWQALKGGE